jgi:hypothetical protein
MSRGSRHLRRFPILVILLIPALAGSPCADPLPPDLAAPLGGRLFTRIRALGYGSYQKIAPTPQNPWNAGRIPRYGAQLNLRPDLEFILDRLELKAKPRWDLVWDQAEHGRTVRRVTIRTDEELYVNEWLARARATDRLFVSYGREVLNWGPSSLLSPSNPFNPDNGRNRPKRELAGLDYARAVWIPGPQWTLSAVWNTGVGRFRPIGAFRRSVALKLDVTASERYATLIAAAREDGGVRPGAFAVWNVSDAAFLYGEAGAFGDDVGEARWLVGGSYTHEKGPNFTAEFFHSGVGCRSDGILACIDEAILSAAGSSDILIRSNYALLQYSETRIDQTVNLFLRWIHGLDDGSSRFIGVFEYEAGDYTQLFTVGSFDVGDASTEFASLLEYALFAGVEFNF